MFVLAMWAETERDVELCPSLDPSMSVSLVYYYCCSEGLKRVSTLKYFVLLLSDYRNPPELPPSPIFL